MSLEITRVYNSPKAELEHVRLRALATVNLKGYAIVDRTFDSNGEPSNEFRHIFLFPDLQVKKGEYIRVYTGEGDYHVEVNANKAVVHYLYWNSDHPVWNDDEQDEAILIKFYIKSRKLVGED